jgi:hypothetical protein
MRRIATLIVEVVLTGALVGCSSDKDLGTLWDDYGGASCSLRLFGPGVVVAFVGRGHSPLTNEDVARVVPILRRVGTIGLNLQGHNIDDVALSYIRTLPDLERLEIAGTNVTPNGLRQLRGMPRLQLIEVSASNVSKEDVEALRKDLPNVMIIRVNYTKFANSETVPSTASQPSTAPAG